MLTAEQFYKEIFPNNQEALHRSLVVRLMRQYSEYVLTEVKKEAADAFLDHGKKVISELTENKAPQI